MVHLFCFCYFSVINLRFGGYTNLQLYVVLNWEVDKTLRDKVYCIIVYFENLNLQLNWVEHHYSSYTDGNEIHIRRRQWLYAQFGTNSQRPPKVVHHLAHNRYGLRKLCTTWHIFAESSESYAPLGTYSQRSPKIVHHLAHIRRDLQKLCITWHISAEVSESYGPRDTYSQKPPKIVHHLAHIPRDLRKLFATWHIFTRLSE